jgi:uncharacterized membrane protein YphA (DoxX/SURF4 family)
VILDSVRRTTHSRVAGGVRLMLALIFLMAGPAKLLDPRLAAAWAGQLSAASIPLEALSRVAVPYLEILLGLSLLIGFYVRPAALIVMCTMVVATYVHLVVDDPWLFPLQPSEPIVPVAVIVGALLLLVKGGGRGLEPRSQSHRRRLTGARQNPRARVTGGVFRRRLSLAPASALKRVRRRRP